MIQFSKAYVYVCVLKPFSGRSQLQLSLGQRRTFQIRLLKDKDNHNVSVLFFKKDKKQKSGEQVQRHVILKRLAADSIITYAKSCHPNEGILILQGQIKKNNIIVEGLVVPPFASHGPYYSGFPTYDLPFDLSYIGTAHSHPGGSNRPSLQDLNNFYGFVSIIISYPYSDGNIGAFDRNGNKVTLDIV